MAGNSAPKSDSAQKPERKRAQPGDFERQVDQIRKDIEVVRANLKLAEQTLSSTTLTKSDQDDEIQPNIIDKSQ